MGRQGTLVRAALGSVDLKAIGSSRAGLAATPRHREEIVVSRRGGP